MMKRNHARIAILGLLLSTVYIAACGPQRPVISPDQAASQVAPTVSSVFGAQPSPVLVPTRRPTSVSNSILAATPNPTAVAQATIAAMGEDQFRVVTVYGDTLSSDWSVKNSFQINIDLTNREYIDQGRSAIKSQPLYTTGILYFTLDRAAKETFLRSKVQAVRFYLSGGANPINNDAIAVAVVGSNTQPYWVDGDTSVKIEGRVTDNQPVFSETRLSFLGINTAIPPKTYVEVTVWLDSLIYDPLYTYVTGFYLKTDKADAPTFYVDQVSLLLLPDKP
ncbi:hypothetical protein K2Z83_14190 [Oscillochloris sp. ZM17-4]|uniref:hypothetical protein n=1 Tax=Oscillochloris sp. ZM17-4 TaxID=2866714 RepID=UPI001C72D620|nr:hypothetical protein [Oscillochloris sp. ZM17-4]MBX0328825.1 hypothetical protein [Oscillochloris sp. ZM17-4]